MNDSTSARIKFAKQVAKQAAMVAASVLALTGCQQQTTQDTPNRVLDRPTDLVLTCARAYCKDADGDGIVDEDECRSQAGSLSQCSDRVIGSCTSRPVYNEQGIGEGDYQLFGFIANSERNEIAMFAQCANRLIDMNIETPGYNFVPSGVLPTHLAASGDGCRVISANVGSCDLSVLGAEGLAGYGLGLELAVDEPSSLVTNLIPTSYDLAQARWLPLGARPADLIVVPTMLTTAPVDFGELSGDQCDPGERGSVYASFPTCNLVAEIDVQTGHVLQSRRFVTNDQGEVEVIDTGISPTCPVECPDQYEGAVPAVAIESGPYPQALELLQPVGNPVDSADEQLDNRALFVGGLGSDSVFEIRIDEAGAWTQDSQSLALQGASGVSRIRVSPPVDFQDSNFGESGFPPVDDRQFLYVIVGDGSTRVVSRALEINEGDPLGIECDTQRDPAAIQGAADWACFPVSDADNIERRALVGGPGIRAANGADVTDWTFIKNYEFIDADVNHSRFTMIEQPGTFAVGTTTRGEIIYVMIDQSRVNGQTSVAEYTSCETQKETQAETCSNQDVVLDPVGLMRVDLAPHSLWPDPALAGANSLPLVRDTPSQRSFPAGIGPSRVLAPSLRLLDFAYAQDERKAALLGGIDNLDLLGGELVYVNPTTKVETVVELLYNAKVPRIAVHDYRAWAQTDWRLQWEGTLIGTQSTGRIACDTPGWEGGTCRVEEADDARLHDSAARFCDSGVQPGDKLVLVGCTDDTQCGEGRRCLRETAGGGDSTGICVSADAYESSAAELRVICRDFISDPCGEARREYTITKAFQDELWIQSMDLPLVSTIVASTDPPSTTPPDQAPALAEIAELEGRWICADDQPEGGCLDDTDCAEVGDEGDWRCIEERCRRACEDPGECILRPLPGPACFAELVPYQVALRNSFLVDGPLATLDRVEVDPDTGECVPSASVETSPLLTSRLRLPASNDADDPDWNAIPLCPTDSVLPTDPNPCRIQSTSPYTRFNRVSYLDQRVDALRFSNPLFSLVLDLTSVESLTDNVPGYDESTWPAEFSSFRRSRIPRSYQQDFSLASGYLPFADLVVLESRPVTLPMRIVPSPEGFVMYVVDGAGPGTSSGIRGQVVRVTLSDADAAVDTAFNGVR